MFHLFERLLVPTALPPDAAPPAVDSPRALLRFYWHFIAQAPWLVVALFATGLVVALLDTTIPVFIGRVASLVATKTPATLFHDAGRQLLGMAAVLLLARPAALMAQYLVTNQAIAAGLSNMIRWQNHWHVVRQSWTFFQNDFAGRIANRVIQTGASLRESVVQGTNAVWYLAVYGGSAIVLLARMDWRLALPIACWFVGYIGVLWLFVPRMRERSRRMSEVRSSLTGRIVDSYTNILTVKLFARSRDEDAFVRDAVDEHTEAFRRQTAADHAVERHAGGDERAAGDRGRHARHPGLAGGRVPIGTVATALPLAWQISNMAGWVAQNITGIFENVGVVQDGMRSIAVPRQMADPPAAVPLRLVAGAIRFERLQLRLRPGAAGGRRRGAARARPHGGGGGARRADRAVGGGQVDAGEPAAAVPRSGLGRILIDGQDIAGVTQESLRAQIGMVTQDTSLLHRSIRDNMRYGRPEATADEVEQAARRAHALGFIERLEDWHGRRGFDAHVGERGVKLSGGQRQRIAIARVVLKDAPILVLDEATSALDSEVEAAIQEQLDELMQGRTVIAIAHRLSTIARMDRLAVLEDGRVVEEGTHAALLARQGAYASLWRRQSGGFLPEKARGFAP